MRILHINCNYIGTTLHQLMIEELERLGIENEVFVPTYDKTIAVIKPNDNVYVSECFNKWDRLIFDYKQKKILKAIEEHYDITGFDIIHAYTLFTDGNIARILSKKYGIPYVVAVRNTDVNDFFKHMIHLRGRGVINMLRASKVFFLSDSYRKIVFEKYIPETKKREIIGKVAIIPNGIDDFWFKDSGVLEEKEIGDTIRLIYAGGIDKNKNITATQGAMRILRNEGVNSTLVVVGKIKERETYEKIVQDKYTNVLPATDKQGLANLYKNADIFIMPSITESFGLVYAEAMSQGLPVIYTAGQGFDGQFVEGIVGYHVCCTNERDIAKKIKMVINNYMTIRKNTQFAARKFNWNSICNEYISVYKSILGCNF